ELAVERGQADPQHAGCLALVGLRRSQDLFQVLALEPTNRSTEILRRCTLAGHGLRGQVAQGDEIAAAEDDGALEDVLELPHVALPRPADQRPERIALDAEAVRAELGVP